MPRILVDGVSHEVEEGVTLAAALINLGHWQFRESVSSTPRAPLCGMGVCFECRVTIDAQPHQRSCMVQCTDGLVVSLQERRSA